MAASRAPSEFYPWTRAYARDIPPSIIFASHDYSRNDPRVLPLDPVTADRAVIRRTRCYALKLPVTMRQLEYLNSVYSYNTSLPDDSSSSSS